MSTLFLMLLFSALNSISAKINIEIKPGGNNEDTKVNYTGAEVNLVSDQDIQKFRLTQENLKKGVERIYGVPPTDVYIGPKRATPWNPFKKYHWDKVKRVLYIKMAQVKNFKKTPVAILTQNFENVLNNSIKVNAGISHTVENTVTSSWTDSKGWSVSQSIDVDFLFASSSTDFSYSSSWGKTEEKAEAITVGTSSSVEIELKPGQKATAVLSADRGYLEVHITYVAILKGEVAVNFAQPHNCRHFYSPNINRVLKEAKLWDKLYVKQILKLKYFTEQSLKVFDTDCGNQLL